MVVDAGRHSDSIERDESSPLLVTTEGAVVTVTLNRPHRRNALTEEMYQSIADVVHQLHSATDVRALILTGAGGSFCSGADVSAARDDTAPITRMRHHSDVALAIHRLPFPTIAAVDGPAVGAGCNMALGCDLVLASDRAFFAEVFVRRGMGFDWGGSWLLPRLVGMRMAKELAFFGERVPADEALRIGLVNRVVPVEELLPLAAEWAGRLASSAPLALTMLKEELHVSVGPPMATALGAETYGQIVQRATSDATEGFASFLEKREPRFEGR